MSDTTIVSELAVDDALVQDADYRFGELDRKYIDDQIRGCEQHLVDCLIRGTRATYARLVGSSDPVVPGDTVCLTTPGADPNEVSVTKSTLVALQLAKVVFGVVLRAAAPGGFVLVAIGGAVPRSITGLGGTGTMSGYVRVNTSTGRCERVDSTSSGDYAVGSVDTNGWLQIVTQNRDGSVFVQTTSTTPARIRRYPIADGGVVLIRAIVKCQGHNEATHYGEYEVKAAYHCVSGTLTQLYAPSVNTVVESDAGLDVTVTLNGNTDIDLNVVGLAATTLDWSSSEMFL